MNVSTGLLPVYTKGADSQDPVTHRLTRFFLRERIGRFRVDAEMRSNTGELEGELILIGVDVETDTAWTVAVTDPVFTVSADGVAHMQDLVEIPAALDGFRMLAFGFRCWNADGALIEVALVSLDIHVLQPI